MLAQWSQRLSVTLKVVGAMPAGDKYLCSRLNGFIKARLNRQNTEGGAQFDCIFMDSIHAHDKHFHRSYIQMFAVVWTLVIVYCIQIFLEPNTRVNTNKAVSVRP